MRVFCINAGGFDIIRATRIHRWSIFPRVNSQLKFKLGKKQQPDNLSLPSRISRAPHHQLGKTNLDHLQLAGHIDLTHDVTSGYPAAKS
ncbi:hypothetical protein CCHOA_01110 [Corynebacterium choanae]|uniref:Uncharacterized protein n=1 Tax=Corynebacterium choanae TaxID=1862358 RepID=A0A3G6J876_9CORY|nr:hypothetical protein CCHOA_01110 [Corynebacterium choanae]